MKADTYELAHLNIDGPVRFRDRQRGRGLLPAVLAPGAFVGLMVAFGLDPGTTVVMAGVAALSGLLALVHNSYRVVLTDRFLHVQCGLAVRRIPLSVIEDVRVTPRRRAGTPFGGGAHRFSLDRSVERFDGAGLDQGVRVAWSIGTQRRVTIIGTDQAEALASEIDAAREVPRRVRVAVGDVDGATDEVDEPNARSVPRRRGAT